MGERGEGAHAQRGLCQPHLQAPQRQVRRVRVAACKPHAHGWLGALVYKVAYGACGSPPALASWFHFLARTRRCCIRAKCHRAAAGAQPGCLDAPADKNDLGFCSFPHTPCGAA